MIKKDLFSIQFIDIVSVENSLPISNYSVNEIDTLAANYLECGGNIHPIIVERTGLDEYRVIEGNLELYAAKKAKEKDKFFEMIRAIILDKKNERFVKEQANLLGQIPNITSMDLPAKLETAPSLVRLENNILTKIESLNQKLDRSSNLNITQRLEELENSLFTKFNELLVTQLNTLKKDLAVSKPDISEKLDINKMSVSELKMEAKKQGFSGYSKFKKADLISLLSQNKN